jgi:hypothetical protein
MALSPNNRLLFVANWVDGTVTVIDVASPGGMAVTKVIDLNEVLVGTGLLGDEARARPALAHPRSLAITNDGDGDDDDESVYVTEFFSQRVKPQGPPPGEPGSGVAAWADENRVGLVYRIDLAHASAFEKDYVSVIRLDPTETGFSSLGGAGTLQPTHCYANQLQSITIHGTAAFVTSICASPRGPTGVKEDTSATAIPECSDNGECKTAHFDRCLVSDPDSNKGKCVSIHNVQTLTYPVIHLIDLGSDTHLSDESLNWRFQQAYEVAQTPDDLTRRYPLVANEIAFEPDSNVAWISANGADALFRVEFDAGGQIVQVGGPGGPFIDLGGYPADGLNLEAGQTPIGVSIAALQGKPVAFVANDVTRNVSVVDLADGALAAHVTTANIEPGDHAQLRGRHSFNTGLGRWSFRGQAWVACQVCHFEGLTDNVTWYFGRGPRQSTSLDASFGPEPGMQRIFNWTAVFDEMTDFERIARDLAGAEGKHDPNAVGLNQSSAKSDDLYELAEFDDIQVWLEKSVRSPDAPSSGAWKDPDLHTQQVERGRQLFEERGCVGCHGGPNWTLSMRFYTPEQKIIVPGEGEQWTTAALLDEPWPEPSLLPPAHVLPASLPTVEEPRYMRHTGSDAKSFDQILCVLREVGTYGVSPAEVGVEEIRQDMSTPAQGGGEAVGHGYNVPSLFGQQTGAPYFHAGNARTLEELFSDLFAAHHSALDAACPEPATCTLSEQDVDALVAFVLSIDEDTPAFALPPAGPEGGDFCAGP